MKKRLPLILSLGTLAVIFMVIIGQYNSLVKSHVKVEEASSKIEATLQRRYDLIPNVVNATKGYMKHEAEVFKSIADARSKIGSATKPEDTRLAETELSTAISRLLVLTENYPELKADKQVSTLMAELEGTENRIFVARVDFNKVATEYNKEIRLFPKSLFASLLGFEKAELYKSVDKANTSPIVDLSY